MTHSDQSEGVRELLAAALQRQRTLTLQEAWQIGFDAGLYVGGEGLEVAKDLNAIGRRHDGWCRLDKDPQRQRRAERYADYWTAR